MVNSQVTQSGLLGLLLLTVLVIILIIVIDAISRRDSLLDVGTTPGPVPGPTPGPGPEPTPPFSQNTNTFVFLVPPRSPGGATGLVTTNNLRIITQSVSNINIVRDFSLAVVVAPTNLPRFIEIINNIPGTTIVLTRGRENTIIPPVPNPRIPPGFIGRFVSTGTEVTPTGPREVFRTEFIRRQ